MSKPNLFIIGTPKCGTTSLCVYLDKHSDIYMAPEKEPHFFSTDMPDYTKSHDLSIYLRNFEGNSEGAKYVGEGSTWYMYSKVAVENILKFNKDAKIIAMVRNPIDMAESLYYQFVLGYEENAPSFEAAWKLQASRLQGENLPSMNTPSRLQYKEVCSLGTQIQRLMDNVPEKQLKIILFDDFINNTAGTFDDTLTFLGLSNKNKMDFTKENESSTPRFSFLAKVSHQSYNGFDPYVKWVKDKLGIKRIGLTRYLKRVNKKKNVKPELSSEFRNELKQSFKSEIQLIEKLMNRDLTKWYK